MTVTREELSKFEQDELEDLLDGEGGTPLGDSIEVAYRARRAQSAGLMSRPDGVPPLV